MPALGEDIDQSSHGIECAERIRRSWGVRDDSMPMQTARHIATQIHSCCGFPDLKCFRLACGWSVDYAVARFHEMCRVQGIKPRGLTSRSWWGWESGTMPNRDYQDLLCRLFETGPVQLGFARDYSRTTGHPVVADGDDGDAGSNAAPRSPDSIQFMVSGEVLIHSGSAGGQEADRMAQNLFSEIRLVMRKRRKAAEGTSI